MRYDKSIAIGLLAFTAIAGYLTMQLPASTMVGEPGPKFFPTVVLVLIAVLSLILLLGRRSPPRQPGEGKSESFRLDEELSTREALQFFAVFLAGLVAMKFIGFLISMIAALAIMLVMAGWKLFPRALLFSVVLMLIMYLLFDWFLEIPLPPFALFRS